MGGGWKSFYTFLPGVRSVALLANSVTDSVAEVVHSFSGDKSIKKKCYLLPHISHQSSCHLLYKTA